MNKICCGSCLVNKRFPERKTELRDLTLEKVDAIRQNWVKFVNFTCQAPRHWTITVSAELVFGAVCAVSMGLIGPVAIVPAILVTPFIASAAQRVTVIGLNSLTSRVTREPTYQDPYSVSVISNIFKLSTKVAVQPLLPCGVGVVASTAISEVVSGAARYMSELVSLVAYEALIGCHVSHRRERHPSACTLGSLAKFFANSSIERVPSLLGEIILGTAFGVSAEVVPAKFLNFNIVEAVS